MNTEEELEEKRIEVINICGTMCEAHKTHIQEDVKGEGWFSLNDTLIEATHPKAPPIEWNGPIQELVDWYFAGMYYGKTKVWKWQDWLQTHFIIEKTGLPPTKEALNQAGKRSKYKSRYDADLRREKILASYKKGKKEQVEEEEQEQPKEKPTREPLRRADFLSSS